VFKKLSVRLSFVLIIVIVAVMTVYTIYLILDRTREINDMTLQKGIVTAKTGAKVMVNTLESIIDDGIFSRDEVFDRTMIPITLPKRITSSYTNISEEELHAVKKYHYATTLDSYLDNVIIEIEDEFLKDPQIEYAVLVDENAYLPTHNSRYSKRLTGDFAYDRNNNRTKRIFRDEVGLNLAKNVDQPYLKQVYNRDTGEVMWDISAPVFVKGLHWGAFRVGISMEETEKMIASLRWKLILLMFSLLFITVVVINRVTAVMMKPLRSLHHGVNLVAKGDLSYRQTVTSNDEIGDLATAFNKMVGDLTDYIDRLKKTTAEKEKIESELKIAHDIQMGILPRTFPAFPEREEFDVYAIIEPAKEVGGDFYDFFLIDDETLCIVIGDVSGKGVPAALFMAVTRTLIKSKSAKNLTPEKVLVRVNEDLSIDNTTAMFTTVFLAILNTKTGELSYSNGGHNVPYILRKNGKIEPFKVTSGIALGVIDTFKFELRKTLLKPGDGLYLYTDGVNEAMDPDHNLYGNKRLESFLLEIGDADAKTIAENSLKDVKAFTRGAAQSDDITIMVLKYM